jgi:hypothetical protein
MALLTPHLRPLTSQHSPPLLLSPLTHHNSGIPGFLSLPTLLEYHCCLNFILQSSTVLVLNVFYLHALTASPVTWVLVCLPDIFTKISRRYVQVSTVICHLILYALFLLLHAFLKTSTKLDPQLRNHQILLILHSQQLFKRANLFNLQSQFLPYFKNLPLLQPLYLTPFLLLYQRHPILGSL